MQKALCLVLNLLGESSRPSDRKSFGVFIHKLTIVGILNRKTDIRIGAKRESAQHITLLEVSRHVAIRKNLRLY